MVRVLISFDEKDLKKLDAMAKRSKKTRAQLIRELVRPHLKKEPELTWKELVKKTAGLWKHKNVDGLEYERKLREEWDR